MKLSVATIVAVASASDEKKVPPRHPLARLGRLNKFAAEWCNDNLSEKQAAHWSEKFDKNTARFERRFEICGVYDVEATEYDPPRNRRDDDEDDFLPRYDKANPLTGIKQITVGFKKWAQRYVADCKNQPGTQVNRSAKWFDLLGKKYQAIQEANAE